MLKDSRMAPCLTAAASSLCSLTRFAETGVTLPLVSTAAVAGARRRDAGVSYITAGLYFHSSGGAGQRGGVRPYTQPNTLYKEREMLKKKRNWQLHSFNVLNLS